MWRGRLPPGFVGPFARPARSPAQVLAGLKKVGWVRKDLACDYIAYAFIPSQRCYLLPFHTLRRAWETMGKHWHAQGCARLGGFRIAKSPNSYNGQRWESLSVCVPIPVLMLALGDAMLVRWTGELTPPASLL